MRVLIADKVATFVAGRLQDLGAEVEVDASLKEESLEQTMKEYDPHVVVVRSTKINSAHIDAAPALSLIVRAGAGVNTIDLASASARGIYVANCPGKNAAAVAELTIGHLVNLDRRIADNVAQMREHRWNKKQLSKALGLRGRTLAVLGCGQIGQEVIRRAQGFGMRIVAWSRSLDDERARDLGVVRAESPEEAVRDADAVTVHLALSHDTRHRIGKSVFDAMRPGTYFINTSRSEVVDEDALLEAVRENDVRAGLDVLSAEPAGGEGTIEGRLVDHPNVYGTHHIGASTTEAEEAVGSEVVRIVEAFQQGQAIPNCVNLAEQSPATHVLVVRHADQVGVLAGVLDVLREGEHNVQEMQNIVFHGAEAACARIAVVGQPDRATVDRIRSYGHVFDVTVAEAR